MTEIRLAPYTNKGILQIKFNQQVSKDIVKYWATALYSVIKTGPSILYTVSEDETCVYNDFSMCGILCRAKIMKNDTQEVSITFTNEQDQIIWSQSKQYMIVYVKTGLTIDFNMIKFPHVRLNNTYNVQIQQFRDLVQYWQCLKDDKDIQDKYEHLNILNYWDSTTKELNEGLSQFKLTPDQKNEILSHWKTSAKERKLYDVIGKYEKPLTVNYQILYGLVVEYVVKLHKIYNFDKESFQNMIHRTFGVLHNIEHSIFRKEKLRDILRNSEYKNQQFKYMCEKMFDIVYQFTTDSGDFGKFIPTMTNVDVIDRDGDVDFELPKCNEEIIEITTITDEKEKKVLQYKSLKPVQSKPKKEVKKEEEVKQIEIELQIPEEKIEIQILENKPEPEIEIKLNKRQQRKQFYTRKQIDSESTHQKK